MAEPSPRPNRRPLLDLDARLPAGPAFLSGLIAVPAFALTESLPIKLGLLTVYILLMAATGQRIKVIGNLVVVLGIVAANLLAPRGLVLAEPFGLPLTEGAFRVGALRAATILGLVFCSRLTVRPGLRLPGRFGGMLGLTFYYFERITARRGRFEWKRFWPALDELLSEAYEPEKYEPGAATSAADGARPDRAAGLAWAFLFGLGHWVAFVVGLSLN